MPFDVVAAVKALTPLSTRIWLGLSLATGFLLFVPAEWIPALPLADLRTENETDLTWGFVFASCLFVGHIAMDAAIPVRRHLRARISALQFLLKWHRLGKSEKAILGYLAEANRRIFLAERHLAPVQRLVDLGMLEARDHGDVEKWFFEVPWSTLEGIRRFRSTVRPHYRKHRDDDQIDLTLNVLWGLNEQRF